MSEDIKFKDFAESALDPLRHDYASAKFEAFLKASRNASCPGCGEVGLYEYEIIDPVAGLMRCPKCKQTVDLKTMMRSWLVVNGWEAWK